MVNLPSPSAAFPSIAATSPRVVNPMSSPNAAKAEAAGNKIDWESLRQRLMGADLRQAVQAADEILSRIEIVHTKLYSSVLSNLMPVFSTILTHRVKPHPDTNSMEHRLRNKIVEILNRLPSNEGLRPHAPTLVALSVDILNKDYEQNAILASEIIFALFKFYRVLPQDHIQPYLDFVIGSYRALPLAVKRNFQFSTLSAGPPPSDAGTTTTATPVATATMTSTTNQGVAQPPTPKTPTAPTATSTTAPIAPAHSTAPGPGAATVPMAIVQATQSNTQPTNPAVGTPVRPKSGADTSSNLQTPDSSKSKAQALAPSPIAPLPSSPIPRLSLRSNASFRVLTECPLVAILIFKFYPKFLKTNASVLINVMMEALSLRTPPLHTIVTHKQKLDSHGQRLYFSRSRELIAAQSKTLSFLTFLLRSLTAELKPYEDKLASNVVALMSTCPTDFVSTRRELLESTRQLLNSDLRNGFYRHIDTLLDERTLLGSRHRSSDHTILRPLAYTTLSGLVQHIRSVLNMNQVSRVVSIFSQVLHDTSMTLPISTQYTAVRCLLSVVDMVSHNKDPDPQVGRDILVRILRTLVDKLSTVQSYLPIMREGARHRTGADSAASCQQQQQHQQQEAPADHFAGITESTSLKLPPGIEPSESIRDMKSTIRAIIVGHKTVIWYINNYRAQREKEKIENLHPLLGSNEEVASAMMKITHTECDLIDRYICLAFPCMKILNETNTGAGAGNGNGTIDRKPRTQFKYVGGKVHLTDQYRDSLTYFAAAFTTMDGYDLRRTLGRRLDVIIEAIVEEPAAMLVPRQLLGINATTSYEFVRILLEFLVSRMDVLNHKRTKDERYISDSEKPQDHANSSTVDHVVRQTQDPIPPPDKAAKRASTYLQLFERALKSMSTYGNNEAALLPHLRTIVTTCLRSSLETASTPDEGDNYYLLLRSLFKSITASKLEASYRELFPLLPPALNGLFRVLSSTDDQIHQENIMELILTIPARSSSLLPHMNLLLRVIVRALQSNSVELANLGLRTLEFWVDNLNPDFLYPELSKNAALYADLMRALSLHLRPAPYQYGLLTLRLLGKLGGKNRQILREPLSIRNPTSIIDQAEERFRISCLWHVPSSVGDDAMDIQQSSFQVDIPLTQVVDALRHEAMQQATRSDTSDLNATDSLSGMPWADTTKLMTTKVIKVDLVGYCKDVIGQSKKLHAVEAFNILQAILVEVVEINGGTEQLCRKRLAPSHLNLPVSEDIATIQRNAYKLNCCESQLRLLTVGLLFASTIKSIPGDVAGVVEGFLVHLLLYVRANEESFVRIDGNGSPINSEMPDGTTTDPHTTCIFAENLGSLKPFGYFALSEDLRFHANPLVCNEALAEFLSVSKKEVYEAGLNMLRRLVSAPTDPTASPSNFRERSLEDFDRGQLVFYENLLHAMCETVTSSPWNRREGLYEGICIMLRELGSAWGRQYEAEIMNVALFAVKSAPKEMASVRVSAFRFMVRVSSALYKGSLHDKRKEKGFVWDHLSGVTMQEIGMNYNAAGDKPRTSPKAAKPPVVAPPGTITAKPAIPIARPQTAAVNAIRQPITAMATGSAPARSTSAPAVAPATAAAASIPVPKAIPAAVPAALPATATAVAPAAAAVAPNVGTVARAPPAVQAIPIRSTPVPATAALQPKQAAGHVPVPIATATAAPAPVVVRPATTAAIPAAYATRPAIPTQAAGVVASRALPQATSGAPSAVTSVATAHVAPPNVTIKHLPAAEAGTQRPPPTQPTTTQPVQLHPAVAPKPVVANALQGQPAASTNKVHIQKPSVATKANLIVPCSDVLHMIIVELASTNQLSRIAARFILLNFVVDRYPKHELKKHFEKRMAAIRRVIFSRSLKLLPLPEQVGAVEALCIFMDQIPGLIPLTDQHLLAFLSELLKTTSVADGEMQDANLLGYVVDKNGHALQAKDVQSKKESQPKPQPEPASSMFLRRMCVVDIDGTKFVLPPQLPSGIQFRVSSISLLRSVIRTHPNEFFTAESSTPVGNIRPHVISLLFRSLVSDPVDSVDAAHAALRDVLSLSVIPTASLEGSKSRSRLPKELLQTCIKPVLLNLREYTRLSKALLRGLSRLLSLLSSWFNKTLGEKLLDHLQQWVDPHRIRVQEIWKQGDEPNVAAAIVGLFALLPHASSFVEPLVKTTIKLESCLPAYKSTHVESPFRKPLAQYLNKHCQSTMMFFFQRLKTPLYSELFQFIVAHEESLPLREYLCGPQCSVNILNVCFERPLGIIRPEKLAGGQSTPRAGSSKTATDLFVLHGIQPDRLIKMRQEIDTKKRKFLILQKEHTRAVEVLQAKKAAASKANSPTPEAVGAMEEAKRKHKSAKLAYERFAKELSDCKQRYTSEAARSNIQSKDKSTKPMTTEYMELQHQGFTLVQSLIRYNQSYLKSHSDVLRAFRLLWRSNGRYLRLQHEGSVPPRYQSESKTLAKFLVDYAKHSPEDVDVLFELPRVFLQPTTGDYLFVKTFLFDTVSYGLQPYQKRMIMQRFFALLAGESSEETKTLSIRLVVYPMLERCLEGKQDDTVPSGGSQVIVDKTTVNKFVGTILFKSSTAIVCGNKLKVELLRICHLLLAKRTAYFADITKEVVKFCWILLKSEDPSCKGWAFKVICKIIANFQTTPSKIVVHVYSMLLRLHQSEGRQLVREAMSTLLPALEARLDAKDVPKINHLVHRLLLDEENFAPLLTHVWHTVVSNPTVFESSRSDFSRCMVNSLNRVGLQVNGPFENRLLCVSVIELILRWHEEDDSATAEQASMAASPRRNSKRPIKGVVDDGATSVSPEKKRKTESGTIVVAAGAAPTRRGLRVNLSAAMVDSIGNFLVRLKNLLADQKIDAANNNIGSRIIKLLRTVLQRWPSCVLRSEYFENTVQLCREDNLLGGSKEAAPTPARKVAGKTQKSATQQAKVEVPGMNPLLLVSCLEFLIIVAECAPTNPILTLNGAHFKEIVTAAFRCCTRTGHRAVKSTLHQFIVTMCSLHARSGQVSILTNAIGVSLEYIILKGSVIGHIATGSGNGSHTGPTSPSRYLRHASTRSPSAESQKDLEMLHFCLHAVEEIDSKHSGYVEKYTGALLRAAENLARTHLQDAAFKQKQLGTSQAGTSSIPQRFRSPTEGILVESTRQQLSARNIAHPLRAAGGQDAYPAAELEPGSITLQVLSRLIQILGNGSLVHSFSKDRKQFLQIIGNILEASNNVHMLLVAVRCVSTWLFQPSRSCPMTSKEKKSIAEKLAVIDFNNLSDIVAQPVIDVVTGLLVSLSREGGEGDGVRHSPTLRHSDAQVESVGGSRSVWSISSHMLLVGFSLTPNALVREQILKILVTELSGTLAGTGAGSGTLTSPSGNTLSRILYGLLCCRFEGLGGRSIALPLVDVMLSMIVPDFTNTAKLIPENAPGQGEVESAFVAPEHMKSAHDTFVQHIAKMRSKETRRGLVLSLRRFVHGAVDVAEELLSVLMAAAWREVGDDGLRLELAGAMNRLVAQPFHSQILKSNTKGWHSGFSKNSVKTMLQAMGKLQPLPQTDPRMLTVLAENYNCWYEALSILEKQRSVLSSSSSSGSARELLETTVEAIQGCYSKLGESDLAMNALLELCDVPETKQSVSLDLHGRVAEALDAYTDLIELVETGQVSPSEPEMQLWEDRWVQLQREQCQLDVVSEYATSSCNSLLMLECAWKERNWEKVRSLCTSAPLIAAVEAGDPTVKLSETLLAVADGKLNKVENLHAQTAQLVLKQWQLFPALCSGSHAHASLLHFFHRLVEIRESGQIMVETSNHASTKTVPDLKNLLSAWRHRLPNDCEMLGMWDELLTWRTHMFNAVTSNFHWSDPSVLVTLHDRPWTAIRMSKTARKHGMRETALLLLNRLTDSRTMEVSDIYQRLREQILSYKNPESDLERTGGLNLINTTNLSFFDQQQKSEIFRLKAIFLASLGSRSKSNQAYCHSAQICQTHARTWISWGGLWSSMGSLSEKQAEQLAAKAATPAEAKDARAAAAKKVAQYFAQAMGCYIEAIQIETAERSRIHLPKCLWMLTRDGASPGLLCQTLENRGKSLPSWVWLPWIPQLLTSLCRAEGICAKSILTRVVKCYPQAVYYSLRAFYLERRDVERAKGISATSSQHMNSVSSAEELMSTLRRSHASLWSPLEAILEELIVKFRPSYEEELLVTISLLLERAETHSERSSLPDEARKEHEDAMLSSWSKTLSRIAAKFFRTTDASTMSSRRDERIKKTAEFKRKYKVEFERDFRLGQSQQQQQPPPQSTDRPEAKAPGAATKPEFTLQEYIVRLQKWKRKLESQVACTPKKLPLIESSQPLAMFAGEVPDLWPGSCDPRQLMTLSEREKINGESSGQSGTASSSAADAKRAANAATNATIVAMAREGIGGDFGGGSVAIEIPGQYCPNSCTSSDMRPNPELHVKLVRFQPFVEVIRRNDQLVRRAGMVGSDGRTYRFLLQFAIPYWTRTDERAAQTAYVIDKFLRRHMGSAKMFLSVQPNAAIPVAQRLRMTLDVDSRMSLDEVWRHSEPEKHEQIAGQFLHGIKTKIGGKLVTTSTVDDKRSVERAARLEVYNNIVEKEVDKDILRDFILKSFPNPECFFQFRKSFATQVAVNSLLQYAFSTAERTPSRFVMVMSDGRVLSPDFRVSYSNQGFIESQLVPYRMTPNIQSLIGYPHLDGAFLKAFVTAAAAIRENRADFDPILRLLMRDDILSWYSKSVAKSDSKMQELEKQLIERVSRNVAMMQARIAECSPSRKPQKTTVVDARARELYAAAANPENLCMMPSNYHPWF